MAGVEEFGGAWPASWSLRCERDLAAPHSGAGSRLGGNHLHIWRAADIWSRSIKCPKSRNTL